MTLELIVMAVSALVMVFLIVHKHFESTRGLRSRMIDAREKTDPILEKAHRETRKFVSYFTVKNGILLANYVFVGVIRFFMNVSRKIHDTSSRVIEKASKKTEDLSRSGAASFYLKKIKETKKEGHVTESL